MDLPEPILILAKGYEQFKVGEHWLWENGYFKAKKPIRISDIGQLRGLRNKVLFIMDGAESTVFTMEFKYRYKAHKRIRVFDMVDLRDPEELKFQITERI